MVHLDSNAYNFQVNEKSIDINFLESKYALEKSKI